MQNEVISVDSAEYNVSFDCFEAPTEPSENLNEHSSEPKGSDPYTVSEDGHIIGHDGFVVPKNFTEFFDRFPLHVRNFVHAHWTHASDTDRRDREQEMLVHLMSLPEDSKYREPGYNGLENGCQDRIQVFHPDSAYGASAKRFFWWLNNYCLRNRYAQRGQKANSNPVCRASTMSFGSADAAGEIIDEDYIFSRVVKDRFYDYNNHRPVEEAVIVNEFLDFVEQHNPELISVLDTIGQADTFVDAQRMLGMTEKLFLRARNRLVVLYKHFRAGEVPPRQRKVYTTRKDMEAIDPTSMKVAVGVA